MAPEAVPDDLALTRYLLGHCAREDEARLDELSIADPAFADRLRAIEHDLADAYVRGELSPADRERWESRYLTSVHGREDLALAEALAARERRVGPQVRASLGRWLAAAAVLVLVGLTAVVVVRRQTPAAPVATAPPAVPPAAPRPAPAPSISLVAMTLTPALRTLAEPPTLPIPAGTDVVNLTLRLEPDAYERYDVAIRDLTARAVVWETAGLTASRANDVRSIAVSIPASTFRSGRYLVAVSSRTRGEPETVATYPLTIVLQR